MHFYSPHPQAYMIFAICICLRVRFILQGIVPALEVGYHFQRFPRGNGVTVLLDIHWASSSFVQIGIFWNPLPLTFLKCKCAAFV